MNGIYDKDAEMIVLGSMFGPGVRKDHVAGCIELLEDEDFFEDKHRAVFAAIKLSFLDGEPLDHALTVMHRLRRLGNKCSVTGTDLHALLGQATTSDIGRYHIKTLKWAARLREWHQLKAEKLGSEEDVERLAEQAQSILHGLKGGSLKLPSPIEVEIDGAFDLFEKEARTQVGLRSGLDKLDAVTGGFLKGQYIIVGAKTSVGKTSFLVQAAVSAAKQSARILYVSLEMPKRQVIHRVLAQEASVNVQSMTNPALLTEEDWIKLTNTRANIPEGIWVVDGAYRIEELVAKVRRTHATVSGLAMLCVDYVQLIRGSANAKTRTEEVGEVSRALKGLANELGICVLAASQLSRQHEHDKRPPRLSDLRESGSLEHDTDVVILLDQDPDSIYSTQRPTKFLVQKNRNGKVGYAETIFNAPLNRFEETGA